MTQVVMLVEDEPHTRERLERLVRQLPEVHLGAVCANCAEARAALDAAAPDILLVDLALPDGSGLQLIHGTAQRWPQALIMVISVFGDEAHVVDAIAAGATGYLLKDCSAAEIEKAIRDLRAGGSPISPAVAGHLLRRFRPAAPGPAAESAESLSQRELDVLQHIARGRTYAETADQLGIAVNTVGTYTKQIYRKLAVSSRGKAVFEAVQRGLIAPPGSAPS